MPSHRLAIYLTRSPLHIGTGEAVDDIDLPVSRQITTAHPNLPMSAQKRALKDALGPAGTVQGNIQRLTPEQRFALFGSMAEADDVEPQAVSSTGMLTPQEAHLLLLPVACGAGGAAWVTSPDVWRRFQRRATLAGLPAPALPCEPKDDDHACCVTGAPVITTSRKRWVVLGPAPLPHQAVDPKDPKWEAWADWLSRAAFSADADEWINAVKSRLVLVSDAVFSRLADLALGNRARNKVGDTVNLWREEWVPEDTVFAGLIGAQPVGQHMQQFKSAQDALSALASQLGSHGLELQMGGKASLGQGFVQLNLLAAPKEHTS